MAILYDITISKKKLNDGKLLKRLHHIEVLYSFLMDLYLILYARNIIFFLRFHSLGDYIDYNLFDISHHMETGT